MNERRKQNLEISKVLALFLDTLQNNRRGNSKTMKLKKLF